MKGIYIIAIAFLASWIEINANKVQSKQSIWKEEFYEDGIPRKCPCPEKNPHNTTTNIPHETDCTKFYKCFLCKGVLQDCPLMIPGDSYTRLHYNRREQVCDWPGRAGCAYCPGKDRNGNWPTSRISHERDNCGKYYECKNGGKLERNCPPNTCFSRTCQDCVVDRAGGNCSPNIHECINGQRCACNCALYLECIDNEWIVRRCPDGLHFNPSTKECTTPDLAGSLLP